MKTGQSVSTAIRLLNKEHFEEQETIIPPKGAQGVLDGLYFKIGPLGKAYYWNCGEWIRSERSPLLVAADIKRKACAFSFGRVDG